MTPFLGRESVYIIIEEDDTAQTGPTGPRWLSLSSETRPWPNAGGRLEVRVYTVDTFRAPEISVNGPELSESESTSGCIVPDSLSETETGFVRCWVASFALPVNDTGAGRYYTITAESPDIDEDYVSEVYQSRAGLTGPGPVEQPQPIGEPVPVESGLAPLGSDLQWVLHFDRDTQEWLSYAPGTPSSNSLDQLVPGEVYWLGVREDQTVVLGGVSRILKAGLNQIVW